MKKLGRKKATASQRETNNFEEEIKETQAESVDTKRFCTRLTTYEEIKELKERVSRIEKKLGLV